jgi:hypothetical protein
MFGLKLSFLDPKPANELAAGKAAGWKLASAGVHIRLSNEISELMGTLLDNKEITDVQAAQRLQNCIDMQEAVDAVLIRNIAPFSPQILTTGQHRTGALIAHGARNHVLMSGTFDFPAAQAALRTAMCKPR